MWRSAKFAAVAALSVVAAGPWAMAQADAAQAAVQAAEIAVLPLEAQGMSADEVVFAGVTGFLHRYGSAKPYLWTRYADGDTAVVAELGSVIPKRFLPSGGDRVTIDAQLPGRPAPGQVTSIDLGRREFTTLARPTGRETYHGLYGGAMLVGLQVNGKATLHVRRPAEDGSVVTIPVSGGFTPAGSAVAGDDSAVVLNYGSGRYGLLDLASATVAKLPTLPAIPLRVQLTPDHVAFHDEDRSSRVFDRTNPAAEPVELLTGTQSGRTAVVGHTVVTAHQWDGAARAYPLGGGPANDVVLSVQSRYDAVVQATDGTALVVGGSGPADWAVRRLAAGADGAVTATPVLHLSGALRHAGLDITQGHVSRVAAHRLPGDDTDRLYLSNHVLLPGSDRAPRWAGGLLPGALPCHGDVACVRVVGGNWYGTAFLAAGDKPGTVSLQTRIDASTSYAELDLPSSGGRVVDASYSYVVVHGTAPARQYVVDLGYDKIVSSGPVTGAALWFDTLWTATGPGRLQPKSLGTGKLGAVVTTGAPCTATELQAAGTRIYWSCGPDGPAGVWDTRRGVNLTVPGGPALLGDGYVLTRDGASGRLLLHNVTGATAGEPVVLGAVDAPGGDGRNVTWAVDRFGGAVAYADGDVVRVVDPGVRPSAPAIGAWDRYPEADFVEFGGQLPGWSVTYRLTRPVAGWAFTVRQRSTGAIVATRTGGPARITVDTHWDGLLVSGAKALSGSYTWRLELVPAAGAPPVAAGSGGLLVYCGAPAFRSFECNGAPSLLGVRKSPSGEGHWFVGDASARFWDNGYTEDWNLGTGKQQVSAIVPFGDINGDGLNDLLVRKGDGKARIWHGIGQSNFHPQGRSSSDLGGGWNKYDTLVHTGDLNGNGRPDLLARDKAGKLWRLDSALAGRNKGRLVARVAVAGTWRGFRIVGPGDITGDGKADLFLLDRKSAGFVADGNGRGGFAKPRRIGSSWGGYNVVIGIGDLNEDAKNDLVTRDSKGVLWLHKGNGKGGFAARTKIGTGWQRYAALF
jgi:hypothetical protein